MLGGFVDRADDVNRIVTMAQDYYPKVINNIYVGGVPQVILHVKVMEVSRTKLRDVGIDFTEVFSAGHLVLLVDGGRPVEDGHAAAGGGRRCRGRRRRSPRSSTR